MSAAGRAGGAFPARRSPDGPGVLRVGSGGVSFEAGGRGAVVSLRWHEIRSVSAGRGGRVRLVWDDPGGGRWSYEVRPEAGPDAVLQEARRANAEWAASAAPGPGFAEAAALRGLRPPPRPGAAAPARLPGP